MQDETFIVTDLGTKVLFIITKEYLLYLLIPDSTCIYCAYSYRTLHVFTVLNHTRLYSTCSYCTYTYRTHLQEPTDTIYNAILPCHRNTLHHHYCHMTPSHPVDWLPGTASPGPAGACRAGIQCTSVPVNTKGLSARPAANVYM